MSIEVKPIQTPEEKSQIKDWMLQYHYLKRLPHAMQAMLGIFHNNEMIGMVIYGIGSRPQSTREIFQNPDGSPIMQNNQMWELQRLFTTDASKTQVPNLASQAIAKGNDWIGRNGKTKDGLPVKAIISYADSAVGHAGSVYKATNATYLGLWDKKHKFIYALGNPRERDTLLSKIVKPIYSYPTTDTPSQVIPNPSVVKMQAKPQQLSPQNQAINKRETIKKLLQSTVNNPETGNKILVATALKYDKNHPAYRTAMGMVNAYANRFGIKLRPR